MADISPDHRAERVACPDCWPHDASDCTCQTCNRTGWVTNAESVADLDEILRQVQAKLLDTLTDVDELSPLKIGEAIDGVNKARRIAWRSMRLSDGTDGAK